VTVYSVRSNRRFSQIWLFGTYIHCSLRQPFSLRSKQRSWNIFNSFGSKGQGKNETTWSNCTLGGTFSPICGLHGHILMRLPHSSTWHRWHFQGHGFNGQGQTFSENTLFRRKKKCRRFAFNDHLVSRWLRAIYYHTQRRPHTERLQLISFCCVAITALQQYVITMIPTIASRH